MSSVFHLSPKNGYFADGRTFYHQQVLKLKSELYPCDGLVQQVINAKLFMDKNYAEQIDLSIIARIAFYSKFHFIRLFKNFYGRTPHQYLRDVRIQAAKQLMKNGTPVTRTCYLVGFESITTFSALFKKMVGLPPSRFIALNIR